jgi:hypothetical protein
VDGVRILPLLIVLAGCGPAIERVETVGPPSIYESTVPCTTPGYCMACGTTFDLKLECGFKFFLTCPGTQRATISDTPIVIHFTDGTSKRTVRRAQITTSACSQ